MIHFYFKEYFFVWFFLLISFASFSQSNSRLASKSLVEWDKTLGDSSSGSAREIIPTSDGGYMIAGGFIIDKYLEEEYEKETGSSYSILKIDSIGNVLWHKVFKTDGHDVLLAAIQTKDKGFLLGGRSQSGVFGDKSEPNKGHHDYWMLKLDVDGNKQWDKTFGGAGADYLWALAQTPDGGYLLAGESSSGATGDKSEQGEGDKDAWIIKTDSLGNKEWDKTFGGWSADVCGSIVVHQDGSALLGCISNSFNPYGEDYWAIKIDAQGNNVWEKVFQKGQLHHVLKTEDGGYLLAGDSFWGVDRSEEAKGGQDGWLIKIDSLGNKLWDKTIGGDKADYLNGLIHDSNGGFILGFRTSSDTIGNKSEENRGVEDFWIVNIDSIGNVLWDKTVGGNQVDYLFTVKTTYDGGIIAAGYSESDISGEKTEESLSDRDIWIVKFNDEENITYPIVRGIPGDITAYADVHTCGTHVSWEKPFVFNPQLFPLTSTHSSGSFFPVGKTTVTYTVKDRQGNATDYAFTITIKDTIPPVSIMATLPDIVENCSVDEIQAPVAFDPCSGEIKGTTTDSLFYDQPGIYQISWQFQDEKGNTTYQVQKVVIADTISPIPLQDSLPMVQGGCSVRVDEIPEAEDNCNGRILGTTEDSLSYEQPGEYFITWRFSDSTGNKTLQRQKVVVEHHNVPIPQLDTLPKLTGSCEVIIQDKPLAMSDCGQTLTATTQDPLQYKDEGIYTVHWVFEDLFGNTSVQTQAIEVKDTLAPLPQIPALPKMKTSCGTTIENIPMAWDNCQGEIKATTQDPLEYEEAGIYTVSWKFDDGNGNQAIQKQTVVITCREGSLLTAAEKVQEAKEAIQLYPNPVQEEINISLPVQYHGKTLRVELYNLSGELVRKSNLMVKDKQLNWSLSNLLEGVYIIKIKDQERCIFNSRFLKN